MGKKIHKPLTDAQREAKRERDRRYREKKRASKAVKPVKAKGLKLKVKLEKKSVKTSPKKLTLEKRVGIVACALHALVMFLLDNQ